MIKTLLPLLLTVAIAPNALPNDSIDPCEEIYIVLLEAVEGGYINKEAADDIHQRCLT